jgi:putative endonuclease
MGRNGLEPVERPENMDMPAWFYILRLESGCLYVGSTTDLEKRYGAHCSQRACRTTKLDPPRALIYSEEFLTFSEARIREAQIKRWSRAKKEALVSGDVIKLRELSKSRETR